MGAIFQVHWGALLGRLLLRRGARSVPPPVPLPLTPFLVRSTRRRGPVLTAQCEAVTAGRRGRGGVGLGDGSAARGSAARGNVARGSAARGNVARGGASAAPAPSDAPPLGRPRSPLRTDSRPPPCAAVCALPRVLNSEETADLLGISPLCCVIAVSAGGRLRRGPQREVWEQSSFTHSCPWDPVTERRGGGAVRVNWRKRILSEGSGRGVGS